MNKKYIYVLLMTLFHSSASAESSLNQYESYNRTYTEIKNEAESSEYLKNRQRNQKIDWLRDQCNSNDANTATISCLGDLSQDLSQQINAKLATLSDSSLTKSHAVWKNYVGLQCDSVSAVADGGSLGPKLYTYCLSTLYQDYLNILYEQY